MNTADAARMSDPEMNPHFRRRWTDMPAPVRVTVVEAPADRLVPIGRALQAALQRSAKCRKPCVTEGDGDA